MLVVDYGTITSDYFKGLKHFMKVIPDLLWGSGLIYGGLERQVRSDVRAVASNDGTKDLQEVFSI